VAPKSGEKALPGNANSTHFFFLPLVASFFPGAWNPEGGEMKGIPRWKKGPAIASSKSREIIRPNELHNAIDQGVIAL